MVDLGKVELLDEEEMKREAWFSIWGAEVESLLWFGVELNKIAVEGVFLCGGLLCVFFVGEETKEPERLVGRELLC